MTQRLRIILADDHAVVRAGLRGLLEPAFEVVGEVGDGRALVSAVESLQPDIVIVDVSMPLLNGIESVRRIRKINRKVKIIFLTMHSEVAYAAAAIEAGASAYLLKSSMGTEILEAIKETSNGRTYISSSIDKEELLAQIARAGRVTSDLTERQREVLQLLAEGKSLKEIADILNVSTKAVEFHKYKIMKQLGLRTNAELTKYAVKLGLS